MAAGGHIGAGSETRPPSGISLAFTWRAPAKTPSRALKLVRGEVQLGFTEPYVYRKSTYFEFLTAGLMVAPSLVRHRYVHSQLCALTQSDSRLKLSQVTTGTLEVASESMVPNFARHSALLWYSFCVTGSPRHFSTLIYPIR